MGELLYLLGPLGCAAMMGVMMWMMRGRHGAPAQAATDAQDQIAALRAEVDALRAQHHQAAERRQPASLR